MSNDEQNKRIEMAALRLERLPGLRRGEGESALGYLGRIRSQLDQLAIAARSQWTGRRTWSTHTYPGGCWICDQFALTYAVLEELGRYYEIEESSILDQQDALRGLTEDKE